jgi:ribosomal protein L29
MALKKPTVNPQQDLLQHQTKERWTLNYYLYMTELKRNRVPLSGTSSRLYNYFAQEQRYKNQFLEWKADENPGKVIPEKNSVWINLWIKSNVEVEERQKFFEALIKKKSNVEEELAALRFVSDLLPDAEQTDDAEPDADAEQTDDAEPDADAEQTETDQTDDVLETVNESAHEHSTGDFKKRLEGMDDNELTEHLKNLKTKIVDLVAGLAASNSALFPLSKRARLTL